MNLTAELRGIDELTAKLGKLAAFENLRPAMNRSLNRLLADVKVYPEPPGPGSFPGFVSDKQRRWFFWALRAGAITVPYVRTRRLGNAWTMQTGVSAGDLTGTLGNNTVYGPFVMARDEQAAIHQGRWPTVERVLEENKSAIVRDFQQEIERLLR